MRRISVRQSARRSHEDAAERNRRLFARHGVLVMNVIGSPGCGKTSILEETARRLKGEAKVAALIGDVRTTLDAERVAACGIQARAIETGGGCHLTPEQVAEALDSLELEGLDFLFIENVGNLVCPSAVDLGEHLKVAVLSVPEGDEKVRKYPELFVRADVLFINKMDLLPHCPYDAERVKADALKARPAVRIFETSAVRGTGFEPWLDFLRQARASLARPATGV